MDAQGNVYCQDKTRYRRAGRWRSNLLGGETGDSIMMFEETVPAGTKSTFHLHHASLILKRDFLAFQRGLQWSQANAYVERCSSRSTANLAKRACVTARYVAVQTERRFQRMYPSPWSATGYSLDVNTSANMNPHPVRFAPFVRIVARPFMRASSAIRRTSVFDWGRWQKKHVPKSWRTSGCFRNRTGTPSVTIFHNTRLASPAGWFLAHKAYCLAVCGMSAYGAEAPAITQIRNGRFQRPGVPTDDQRGYQSDQTEDLVHRYRAARGETD